MILLSHAKKKESFSSIFNRTKRRATHRTHPNFGTTQSSSSSSRRSSRSSSTEYHCGNDHYFPLTINYYFSIDNGCKLFSKHIVSPFDNGIPSCDLRFEYRLHYWKIPDILAYIARFRECPNSHKVAVNGTEGKGNVFMVLTAYKGFNIALTQLLRAPTSQHCSALF